MYSMFLKASVAVLLLGVFVAHGQESPADQPKKKQETISMSSMAKRIAAALQEGESGTAIAFADAMVRQHRDDPNALRVAADVYLRTGKVESAARFFDRYVKSSPRGLPGLWQRGIALYFIGEYSEAAKQFEEHRKVNPFDVENAAWHFVCVAKAESAEQAKELVLPAPNDSRIPMRELHQMLTTGDTDVVIDRMSQTADGSEDQKEAEFYGNFYLGLYADALGEQKKARKYLALAAEDAPHHYMGDIARVYASRLGK